MYLGIIYFHNIMDHLKRLYELKFWYNNVFSFLVSEIVDKNQKFRKDKRCGSSFKLDNGNISECDPYNDLYYCCSKWGYCGPGADHCDCPECVDYRNENSPGIQV